MKKFIAIVASAVLTMSALSLVACDNTDDDDNITLPSAPSGNYEEVDITDSDKKEEFLDEVTTRFDVSKMFGDLSSSDWSFGLASDITAKLDASFTGRNIPSGENKTSNVTMSGNVLMNSSAKIKVSAGTDDTVLPFNILAAADANIKGNIKLPDIAYESMGAQGETVKNLISNFDYSAKAYLDSEYLYASLPTKIVGLLPAEAGIPSSGKIKLPLDVIFNDTKDENYYSSNGALSTELITNTIDGSAELDVSKYVTFVLDLVAEYNVSVSVSTDDGYTVKLNAGIDSLYALIADLDGTTVEMVEEFISSYGKVNTCELEAYISVDNDGLFNGLGISLIFAADANISSGTVVRYSPTTITGSAKIQYGLSFSRYDGTITLPSDLNSYVDVTSD